MKAAFGLRLPPDFLAAFLAGAFLAGAFLAGAFLAAFLAGAFLAAFFAAAFFFAAFFAAGFGGGSTGAGAVDCHTAKWAPCGSVKIASLPIPTSVSGKTTLPPCFST